MACLLLHNPQNDIEVCVHIKCCIYSTPLLFSRCQLSAAFVVQLHTNLPAFTVCALASAFADSSRHCRLQQPQQSSSLPSAPHHPCGRRGVRSSGRQHTCNLQQWSCWGRCRKHLTTEQAWCWQTPMVKKYLRSPDKKIDCSGLAGNDRLWS